MPPPKKRDLEEGGSSGGAPSSQAPALKKRCRSFDLEIRGCRHLQELTAAVKLSVEAALEAAVAGIPEEVAKAFTSFLNRAPSLCRTLVDQNQPPRYKLTFTNGLGSEVFTKKVICDTNGEPLKICVTANGQDETDPRVLSAKIRVVVLDGDFNRHNQECWTWEEFNNSTVRPRDKVGAVLTGDLELSLTNGEAYLNSATFIDNSKFVRSGKFRLGVMVIDNLGERVQEGVTEPFTVKERRGEGYRKHDIPSLSDDVWRLKKISKDGAFYDALRGSGILFVKDFLRLYYKDEQALRNILIKATELAWTTIVEHAKKCDPGRELYSFLVEGNSVLLFFNSAYQIVGAKFGDNYLPFNDLEKAAKELVIQWSKVAYENIPYKEPDYELDDDDGKPRPINEGMSMLEHKFTDCMQDRNVCEADNQQGTSCSHSKQCTFKRLGSIRLTQNDEDESFDISVYMDSISEHCATTSANDITGLVTLRCPAAEANEATGSVVLTQASLTVDDEVYNIPLVENGNHNFISMHWKLQVSGLTDPICFCRCCSHSAV
ncbi:calmodulin-binding protein 60 C-like [Panicum virgatum]|uniref:calmodulin-binding protein 60 C-like n=1 Tax=Panicum virgatum TaxID=38727 RepID=UPI0019D6745A|nr:calmodulin-binding protein 60 C-like [Panicum virgatum]